MESDMDSLPVEASLNAGSPCPAVGDLVMVGGICRMGMLLICDYWQISCYLASHLSKPENDPITITLIDIGQLDKLVAKNNITVKNAYKLPLKILMERDRLRLFVASIITKIATYWPLFNTPLEAFMIYNCKEIPDLFVVEYNPTGDPLHQNSDYLIIYESVILEYSHGSGELYF